MKFAHNPLSYAKRQLLFLSLIAFILSACKKDNNKEPDPVEFTPIPSATPVSTTITTYVASNYSKNVNVTIGLYNAAYGNGGYFKEGTFDQFHTYIAAGYLSGFQYFSGLRFIPVSNSPRNYADIAMREQLMVGNVSLANSSGYFPLPKGGKINYPNNGFGSGIRDEGVHVTMVISDPAESTFAIDNPVVAVDLDDQRWFLRSYLSFLIQFDMPLMPGKMAELEYPIPPDQLVSAPDSIEAYHWESGLKWVKRGVAKKQGNVYRYALPDIGAWSFGTRQKGIYKTFQVRTSTGIPVINAIVQLKSGATQIGAARTDADGNAICFVPVDEAITLTIPFSWESPNFPPTLTTTVGPFNFAANTPVTINYPSGTTQLRILKGKAINCDGTPVKKGLLTVVRDSDGFEYCHIPVVEGQYRGAVIRDQFIDPPVCVLKLRKDAATPIWNDTAIGWNPVIEKMVDLNTCKTPTNLFMDYTLDGVSTSIKGDAVSPHITIDAGGGNRIVSATDGSKSFEFQFNASFSWPGTHPSGFSWLWINNALMPNCQGTLTFTRYDLVPGGYMEGSFDMYYYEGPTKHELKGRFRLFRAS